jgi:hypothetical protein
MGFLVSLIAQIIAYCAKMDCVNLVYKAISSQIILAYLIIAALIVKSAIQLEFVLDVQICLKLTT